MVFEDMLTNEQIVEILGQMTVLELLDLTKDLEKAFQNQGPIPLVGIVNKDGEYLDFQGNKIKF